MLLRVYLVKVLSATCQIPSRIPQESQTYWNTINVHFFIECSQRHLRFEKIASASGVFFHTSMVPANLERAFTFESDRQVKEANFTPQSIDLIYPSISVGNMDASKVKGRIDVTDRRCNICCCVRNLTGARTKETRLKALQNRGADLCSFVWKA